MDAVELAAHECDEEPRVAVVAPEVVSHAGVGVDDGHADHSVSTITREITVGFDAVFDLSSSLSEHKLPPCTSPLRVDSTGM